MTATTTTGLADRTSELLRSLGAEPLQPQGESDAARSGGVLAARSPVTGETLGLVPVTASAAEAVTAAAAAYAEWSTVPAPVRGAVVRELGELLREHKSALGELVSIEAGKIVSEGLGEVQEMIDICDFGVGLSRQLHGSTIATERPGHRMMEQWHPLGVVAVVTAFNFPVAVWSWNAVLALVALSLIHI